LNIVPKRGLHYGLFRKTSPPWHADPSTSTAVVVMRANSDTTRSILRAMNRANQCPCRTVSTAGCFFSEIWNITRNVPYMICLANPIFLTPATDWVIGGIARAVVNHQSSGSERALSLLFRGPKIEAHPTVGLEQGSVRFDRSGICGIGR